MKRANAGTITDEYCMLEVADHIYPVHAAPNLTL